MLDIEPNAGIVLANGEQPQFATLGGLRVVRLDFTGWQWRNGGQRPREWLNELLDTSAAAAGLSSTAGALSANICAALSEVLC